ncbi:MAG: ATP-dependent RecD-like DNA helicase [Clostridia bacterium]
MAEMAEVEGVVEEVVFRNDQNGFTVMSVKAGREHVTCVGVIPAVSAGERLKLQGTWSEHRDYGRQLKVSTCESVRPTTRTGIEKYLGSGVIRGVGPATAKLIVHEFGESALSVLDTQPERLTEISGIGPKRAAMIEESYRAQRESRQTMVFLQTYGLSVALAMKVVRVFGDQTQQVVRDDPYLLADKVEGVGFKTCDAIAFSLGVEPESAHRLTCGVRFVLEEAVSGSGHMFLPRSLLLEKAKRLLAVGQETLEVAIRALVLSGEVIERVGEDGENVVYKRQTYRAEQEVAKRLSARLKAAQPAERTAVERKIAAYQADTGVTLSHQQLDAVRAAMRGSVTVLTGGPGTGKTTCIDCMVHLMGEAGKVKLCAPTGRAAKRMQEATGEDAQTIHRLLEYGGEGECFQRDEQNPLVLDTLIVDELSMVDIFLMCALLRALPEAARLVLVGDADQLPSVGAGNVLGDLIESGAVPVIRLSEIYRQAEKSAIIRNAHRINHGEMPVFNQKGSDCFFEKAQSPEQAAQIVGELVKTRLPKFLGSDPLTGIQVMSPMKKGECGVWALNRRLQELLNPAAAGKRTLAVGDSMLREGDKVMQMRNNYDIEWEKNGEMGTGAFNGDIGFVEAIDPEGRTAEVHFDDERVAVYEGEALEDLSLAYCMSVHKSQGSEFGAVVLPLISGPAMLYTRNLLYTAVTRARKLVVVVGREACVMGMVENNYISKRYSDLARVLREMLGETPER